MINCARNGRSSRRVAGKSSSVRGLFRLTCLGLAVAAGCSRPAGPDASATGERPELPAISKFLEQPSDRFLVDVDEISGGHPFKGADAEFPHAGAHVHFDNTASNWPKNGDARENYPAVYAVADGVVSRVDTHFPLQGGNVRYGVDLTFARDGASSECRFCYSIEPMSPEPAKGFYEKFLLVTRGQKVRKGDLIAYLYTPAGVGGCHIHFHIMIDGKRGFFAPAIFSDEIVRQFYDRTGGFKEFNQGGQLPACMGYKVRAEENPFGSGAKETL